MAKQRRVLMRCWWDLIWGQINTIWGLVRGALTWVRQALVSSILEPMEGEEEAEAVLELKRLCLE